jgi:hypothetical protein
MVYEYDQAVETIARGRCVKMIGLFSLLMRSNESIGQARHIAVDRLKK